MSARDPLTLVSFIPETKPSPCGYCKGPDSRSAGGMWAHFMSVQQYKNLLDRGWRRSGRYVYKSNMELTCCPLYTIRCEAGKYEPTRSQKKVAKKVKNFLLRGSAANLKKDGEKIEEDAELPSSNNRAKNHDSSTIPMKGEGGGSPNKDRVDLAINPAREGNPLLEGEQGNNQVDLSINPAREERRVLGLKKAKVRRIERNRLKAGVSDNSQQDKVIKSCEKTISDHLPSATSLLGLNHSTQQVDASCAHNLSLRLVKADPKDKYFQDHFEESFQLFKKYQMKIHEDKEDEWAESGFKEFLCDSPLAYEEVEGCQVLLGAYHQHYLLDGKLIAVGVLDILPGCVSSVYFYYDPEYSHLSLGTYSAIREIQLTVGLGLKYYYLGFYIHSCDKMRYKGRYSPSDLLSPSAYTWHPIQQCIPLLETNKYSTLNQESSAVPRRAKANLRKVKLYLEGDIVAYNPGLISTLSSSQQGRIGEFLEVCGDLAENIILVLNAEESDEEDS